MNSTETGYLSTAQSMNALVDRIRLLLSRQEVATSEELDWRSEGAGAARMDVANHLAVAKGTRYG
jgi:hypothetical protein